VAGRDISVTELDNGIRVITEHLSNLRSAAIGIWVGSGSRLEGRSENGISHFIEHMLFKGTENRSAEQIAMEMDSLGGHMDAYTSRELVSYNTKVLDERLPEAFDVLSDLVLRPLFQPGDIEREKGVILEELKMELDNPEFLVHEAFVRNFWGDHPLGWSIIGTVETIQSFEQDSLRSYWKRVYAPENLILTAAGNIRHQEVADLAAEAFRSLPRNGFEGPRMPDPPTPFLVKKAKDSLEQMHLLMGAPACAMNDPRRYAAYVLSTILGGGMSSRLFQNIRERHGLAYAVFSELHLNRDSGVFQIYAGTSPETAGRVVELMMDEIRRIKQELVPADELRRAKDHLKGATALSLEGSSSRMSNLARQALFHQRFYSIEEMLDLIEAVTADDVQQMAQASFRSDQLGLAALGRVKEFSIEAQDLAC
jgi:predicted Zn-dependent peptidase